MEAALQNVYLNVPKTEIGFIMALARKMGWQIETKSGFLHRYIASRPKNVPISDDDILSELNTVRYQK